MYDDSEIGRQHGPEPDDRPCWTGGCDGLMTNPEPLFVNDEPVWRQTCRTCWATISTNTVSYKDE